MSDELATMDEGAPAPVTVIEAPADTGGDLSVSQAARALIEARKPKPADGADPAAAEDELAQANPESPEPETTEGDEETEPAKPAIGPPKSWTKDLHEHWASLDPVLQERIVARDREDQAAIKRAFNEAADARKAIDAELAQTKEARQQYETKTKSALEVLEREQLRDFPDIKTMADVAKMALEDPFRKIQWDVHQDQIRAATWESQQAEQHKAQERQSKRNAYEAEQNKLLVELVPEMADPKKASELRERAVAMLTDDLGLKNDLLTRWMQDDTGHEILSNAGIQKLIADGLKYRDIQKAPRAIAAKPLPPVQRPGVARPAGTGVSEQIQALTRKLETSGSLKDAQALRQLQLKQRRA